MKIRWRQQEIVLVSAISALILADYLWGIHTTDISIMAKPFADNNVPFSLYRNLLIPQIGSGLLIYLSYLWIVLYTVPRLLFSRKAEGGTMKLSGSMSKGIIVMGGMAKKMIRDYAWVFIQIIVIILVDGTAFNIASYYIRQWQLDYPGFSIFFNKNEARSQMNIFALYFLVTVLLAVFALYLIVREFIIHRIERSGDKRPLYTIICNQVTLFVVAFVLAISLISYFNLVQGKHLFLTCFSTVLPVFLLYMSNTYWLFPEKKEKSFFHSPLRLLLSSLLCSLPFLIFLADKAQDFGLFFYYWLFQLFIVTPLTWILFQKRRDEILALTAAQKKAARSSADLQLLRSQINPHFLFNVLNTLYGTALQENADRTATGIQMLGDMMRFMLHENNLDFIDMNKEISYLRNYISLQKLRTQSSPNIIIEENISQQICNHRIAPMLLIPLIENAFKHGISLKEKSWIRIMLQCDETNINFETRNSVHPKQENDPEKERSGIGFKNVLERLKLIYGGRFQISFNKDEKEFFVRLSIQP
ncbi:MAG TPA: histidine kinase [Puia sp.]|nr:histidine kinase [Puia sp.]